MEQLAAIQAATAATTAQSSALTNTTPKFADHHCNASFLPNNPKVLSFLCIANKITTMFNNYTALCNLCAEPICLCLVFFLYKIGDNANTTLMVCSSLHYHAESIIVPTHWDNTFFGFKNNAVMGQMPPTIKFDED
eukprot:12770408-Ditylum_brightwellii.AAC.1